MSVAGITQLVIIDSAKYKYTFVNSSSKNGEQCTIVNVFSKEIIDTIKYLPVKPFLCFRVYNSSEMALAYKDIQDCSSTRRVDEFISENIKKFTNGQLLQIDNLASPEVFGNISSNYLQPAYNRSIIQGLLLQKGNLYLKITGFVDVSFYNILSFKQQSILQSSDNIINILSDTVRASRIAVNDGERIALMPARIFSEGNRKILYSPTIKKIFLEAKDEKNNIYHFYCSGKLDGHSGPEFLEEFDYVPETGIINFVSPVLKWGPVKFGEPDILHRTSKFYRFTGETINGVAVNEFLNYKKENQGK